MNFRPTFYRSPRAGFILAVQLAAALFFLPSAHGAEDRNAKILDDRASVQEEGLWIYNDLSHALALGKETGKPILVALRCVP